MDLQIPSFPILLCFFLFLSMVLKILKKRPKTVGSASKLPPGPWKLPLIGNLHHLVGPLPHHTCRELANKYGPLMYLKIGQVPTIAISSPEYAKEVMKTHDVNFAARYRSFTSSLIMYDFNNIIFAPYGVYWRQLRKIWAQELFSERRVQSFGSIREEETSKLIKWIGSKSGSPINLTDKIISTTFRITSRASFGKEIKGCEELISIVEKATGLASEIYLAEIFPSFGFLARISPARAKSERLRRRASEILENIIDEHQEKKKSTMPNGSEADYEEDLIDTLLKYHNNDDLGFSITKEKIKSVMWDIISAGSETSATTVDWAMAEMTKNPRAMKKARDEVREVFRRRGLVDETGTSDMAYLKCVVKETLRLHPPAPLIPKECQETCEINGYEIPAKTRIMVNAWAIGRDPRFWAEPESFVPERFLDSSVDFKGLNFEYIPFGAGRRICPGISFGTISVEFQLAMLLYHFDWKLPNGMKNEDLDMTEKFGKSVRRSEDLHLIPTLAI